MGSRDYPNPAAIERFVESLPSNTIVVSGGARGTDTIAENAARARGLKVQVFPAQWNLYGRSAGYKRNVLIVLAANYVVAFWDGTSPGTKHTIDIAKEYGKRVVIYDQNGTNLTDEWNEA